MRTCFALFCSLMSASLSLADDSQKPSPEIEVEVRFVEIPGTVSWSAGNTWHVDSETR